MPESPRRINSINIFTSKGDDFDNLVLILASFHPLCIYFKMELQRIGLRQACLWLDSGAERSSLSLFSSPVPYGACSCWKYNLLSNPFEPLAA
jgi:hypothetical protein